MAESVFLAVLQIAIAIGVPVLTLWLEPKSKVIRFLSPVVICYVVGMLFGNQPWVHFSNQVSLITSDVTVAMAIPLLLFSVDIIAWMRLAKNTVLSFFLCMVSVMVVGAIAHFIFGPKLDESAEIAGMLAGVYTGGTPNMAAVATALNVKSETFILLNAADMVASFGYLLFILTVAGRLLSKLVPPTPRDDQSEEKDDGLHSGIPAMKVIMYSLLLTGAIVGVAVAMASLFSESVAQAVAILVITSLAIVASTLRRVRALKGTHEMGQFLLLVFCVAMGFTTNFGELFSSTMTTFLFVLFVLFGSVLLHFSLAVAMRIDRDTIIITSTAAIFGPHMVGPVALSLKNKQILFSGLASGLVGYAVGNYLGVALAWILG